MHADALLPKILPVPIPSGRVVEIPNVLGSDDAYEVGRGNKQFH